MNRWSKAGVLRRLFEALQVEGVIQIKMESVCLDSTTVKVHPDGTGPSANSSPARHGFASKLRQGDGGRYFFPQISLQLARIFLASRLKVLPCGVALNVLQ